MLPISREMFPSVEKMFPISACPQGVKAGPVGIFGGG